VAEPFSKWGVALVHVKTTVEKLLWFELVTVTSQALKYDAISYTPYEGLNYTVNVSVNHLKFKWAVTGVTQVNSVTRAHHTIYFD